jgi:hypothetical protein
MSTKQGTNHDHPKGIAYHSYLLRFWRVDQCWTCDWRASLEDPRTGERIGFANLEDLFVFLMEQAKKAT